MAVKKSNEGCSGIVNEGSVRVVVIASLGDPVSEVDLLDEVKMAFWEVIVEVEVRIGEDILGIKDGQCFVIYLSTRPKNDTRLICIDVITCPSSFFDAGIVWRFKLERANDDVFVDIQSDFDRKREKRCLRISHDFCLCISNPICFQKRWIVR